MAATLWRGGGVLGAGSIFSFFFLFFARFTSWLVWDVVMARNSNKTWPGEAWITFRQGDEEVRWNHQERQCVSSSTLSTAPASAWHLPVVR
jgi:hypothetical protein